MNLSEVTLLFSSCFAGAIAAYPALATRNAWPRGRFFENGISSMLYLGVMVFGLAFAGAHAYFGKGSWWMILWLILASFVGAPLISAVFGKISGSVAIIGAVLTLCLAIVIA